MEVNQYSKLGDRSYPGTLPFTSREVIMMYYPPPLLYSSNFPLASSSIAIDQHYNHDNLWDDESINVSASIQLIKKYQDMLNSINNNQPVCTKTVECAAKPGTDCCWIPGRQNTKQCTTRNGGDRIGWNLVFTGNV